MKLAKKILSAVCALGMIATAFSSMIVAQAVDNAPTIKLNYTWTDQAAGTGVLTAVIEGATLPTMDGVAYPTMAAFQATMTFSDNFDTSLYVKLKLSKNIAKTAFTTADGTFTNGTYNTTARTLAPNWFAADWTADQLDRFSPENFENEIQLFTLNFALTDPTALSTITLSNVQMGFTGYNEDGDKVNAIIYGNAEASDNAMNIETLTLNDEPVAAAVTTDPAQVGEVFQGTSGGVDLVDDYAVAYKAGFKANDDTVNGVNWSVTVDDTTKDSGALTFGTPVTGAGEVFVGLVINGLNKAANSVALTLVK